jgi:hypothetical protein
MIRVSSRVKRGERATTEERERESPLESSEESALQARREREKPGPESIESRPIAARKNEIINVSSEEDIMTIDSGFPHTLLITNFRAAFLFEESTHGLEPSACRTGHAIKRFEEAIAIFRILRKPPRSRNV